MEEEQQEHTVATLVGRTPAVLPAVADGTGSRKRTVALILNGILMGFVVDIGFRTSCSLKPLFYAEIEFLNESCFPYGTANLRDAMHIFDCY